MKYIIAIKLILCVAMPLQCQIMNLNTIASDYFKDYDLIFLGEDHKAKGAEEIEEKFIQLFKTGNTKILLEKRYDFYFLYKDFFIKRDTSEFVNYYNPNDRNFARFIYYQKLPLKAIDVLRDNDIYHDPIFRIFDSKRTSPEKQREIDSFIYSKDISFSGNRKSVKKNSYLLLEKWDSVKMIQKKILGPDSTLVEEYFEALRAALLASDDRTTNTKDASAFREKFMLSMVQKELAKDSTLQLISINGQFHIFLSEKDKWVKSNTYEPLAKLAKERLPDKKICSIYLFNWSTDKTFNKLYPKELEYILENTKYGETYLIDPDYEGSPLKKLKENFTYILVY